MLRKVLASLLVGVMLVSTAGCGASTEGAVDSGAKAEETKEVKEGQAGQEKSDQTANTGEVVELDLFINEAWWPVDSFTGIIPEAITEKTGVKLNVTVTGDSSQLGVMIASNELPDIVMSSTEYERLSNPLLTYSYPELTELYGYEFNGNEEQVNIAKSFSSDERYYCLLNWYDTQEDWENLKVGTPGQCGIFYRKDLLDAANIKVPETAGELMSVLEECKQAYPEMTPLGLGGVWKLQAIGNWLGLGDSIYDGETYYYDSSAPAYEEVLKYYNQLYRKGYITAEDYANENEADGHQNAYNNGCVFYSWYTTVGNMNQLNSETVKNQEDAKWGLMAPLTDLNGEMHANYGTGKGWAGTFVSKTCKDPEAAARLISFLYSEEGQKLTLWGREGIDYTEVDGEPQFSEEWLTVRKSSDEMNAKFNPWFYIGAKQTVSLKADYSGIDEEIASQYTPYGEGFKNYAEVGIAMPTASSDEGVIKTKLDEMKKAQEAKVIFAESEEAFATYFAEYKKAMEQVGVNTLNEYLNQRIKEIKEQFGF